MELKQSAPIPRSRLYDPTFIKELNRMNIKLYSIEPANDGKHKYVVMFYIRKRSGWKVKRIAFGAYGMGDYTIYNQTEGKESADNHRRLYIQRHSKREDWNDPLTAGFWSRWILWEKPTLKASVEALLRKYPEWRI